MVYAITFLEMLTSIIMHILNYNNVTYGTYNCVSAYDDSVWCR